MDKHYKKLLIIDGSYLLHRSLKVPEMWDLRSSDGRRSGGVYGFLNSLNYLINNHSDYFPVVAWDNGRSPRRLEIYPRYKNEHLSKSRYLIDLSTLDSMTPESIDEVLKTYAKDDYSMLDEMRVALQNSKLEYEALVSSGKSQDEIKDDDYVSQYVSQKNDIIYLTEKLGIPNIIVKNWEGDDIITLISRISTDSYIVTDDRDMIQLISPDISIIRPLSKEILTYNEYLLEENISSPRELVIRKAILGDGSDAIPSATSELERKYRVGEVRAKSITKILYDNNERFDDEVKRIIETDLKNPGLGFIQSYDNYLRNLQLVDLGLVPDDLEIYNSICESLSLALSRQDLLGFITVVSKYEIKTVDYQNMMSKIRSSYSNINL